MIDLYLRAGNAGALAKACPFLRDEGEWLTNGDGWALDVIGSIVTTPGTFREEGEELTPPVIDDRFHANLCCTPEIAELVPSEFIVTPRHPIRVWA